MASDAAVIEMTGLGKSFGAIRAVDALSFAVHPGEIFGLVVPDGAGKTTTMRMLAGVLAPDTGSAQVAGFDIAHDPESAKHHLSYMPQRFGLYEDLTVDENIAFYGDLFSVPKQERETRARQLLTAAGLSEFRKRMAGKLSGGMKQKLGLVCALIHRPKVILLDEPTNGVDPVSRRDFWAILYSLIDGGVGILISTSYLDEAERCHRVGLLHKGKLLFCDRPEILKKQFPGSIFAVRTGDPARVSETLKGAPGVNRIVLEGDGVHIIADRAERQPELQSLLSTVGIQVEAFARVEPTIEDLFVFAVTDPSGRESPGAEATQATQK